MSRRWIMLTGLLASLLLAGHVLRGAVTASLPPLSMWGDSQTAPGSGYGDRLASMMPGRRSYNLGIGGQRLEMIAARMGAVPVTLRRKLVLPGSGPVDLGADDLSIDLLRGPSDPLSVRISVGGVQAALVHRPGADPKHGLYTLSRLHAAQGTTSLDAGTPVMVLSGTVRGDDPSGAEPLPALFKDVVVLRAGRNNLNDPGYDIDQGLRLVGRMVDTVQRHTRKIVIIGQMLGYGDLPPQQGGGSTGAERSAALLALQARWNRELAQRFPGYYADVQAYHVAHGGGESVTLPAQGGTARFTVLTRTAPLPVLADGVHENAVGQQQTAEQVKAIIAARNY